MTPSQLSHSNLAIQHVLFSLLALTFSRSVLPDDAIPQPDASPAPASEQQRLGSQYFVAQSLHCSIITSILPLPRFPFCILVARTPPMATSIVIDASSSHSCTGILIFKSAEQRL